MVIDSILFHKMTGQSLKLGKFMTDQVANMFGHVRWPNAISTSVKKYIKKNIVHQVILIITKQVKV